MEGGIIINSDYFDGINDLDDFILVNGDNVVDPEIISKLAASKNTGMIIDNIIDS